MGYKPMPDIDTTLIHVHQDKVKKNKDSIVDVLKGEHYTSVMLLYYVNLLLTSDHTHSFLEDGLLFLVVVQSQSYNLHQK